MEKRSTIIVISFVVGLLIILFHPVILFLFEEKFYLSEYDYRLYEAMFPLLGYIIILIGVFFYAFPWIKGIERSLTTFKIVTSVEELEDAKKRIKEEPQKIKPTWDLARVKLELYFDRNINQINYIFWLSVIVMLVGFLFILFGISQTFGPSIVQEENPNQVMAEVGTNGGLNTAAAIGFIVGVITEFIGATFLFVYRSLIQQAATYTSVMSTLNCRIESR